MQWGLIFRFYISTKWLSYRNISLPTAEICHHGNFLSLEGWGALGKYGYNLRNCYLNWVSFLLSFFNIYEVLHTRHCSRNQIRERLYGFKLCFLFLKEQCLGQFPPLFDWLHHSLAAAPDQFGSPGAAGPCSALVPAMSRTVTGGKQKSRRGPRSSAVWSILFIYLPQYTHSSILFCLTYMSESNFRP